MQAQYSLGTDAQLSIQTCMYVCQGSTGSAVQFAMRGCYSKIEW